MTRHDPADRWRRFARDLGPTEAEVPPRFARPERLAEHVEKHLLKGRDERWHRVVAHEVLADAREERLTLGWGSRCDRLAEEYEGLVGAIVVERCREGGDHCHQLTVRDPEGETVAEAVLEETVYAWDLETRVLAIAARRMRAAGGATDTSANGAREVEIVQTGLVSPPRWTPYRLLTGYRFHADRTEAGFRKEIRRKLSDLETFTRDRFPLWTVTHDGPTATNASERPTELSR